MTTTKRKKKSDIKVTAEEFVEIWQTSNSIEEILKRTSMSRSAVYGRSYQYRKDGIPLKRFRRGRRSSDIQKLTELAEKLAPAEAEADDVIF